MIPHLFSKLKEPLLVAMGAIFIHSTLLSGQEYQEYIPWNDAPSFDYWPPQETAFNGEPVYYHEGPGPYYYEPPSPPYYAPPTAPAPVNATQPNPPADAREKKEEKPKESTKKDEKPNASASAGETQPKPPVEAKEKKEEKKEELPKEKKEEKPKEKKDEKPKEPAFLIPLSLGHCGQITFKPGLRVQVRYNYERKDFGLEDFSDVSYGEEAGLKHRYEHDIFIRRFRIKCSGDAFEMAKYLLEFKIDNVGRYSFDPKAEVENAWLDFTLYKNWSYLRVGLYDIPVSRDALTSDSKLLFMDRTLIKEKLTELGLADNTIGVMWHGRPYGGRFEYAVGIFDNIKLDNLILDSRNLMPAGRLVVNLLDPQQPPEGYADYEESYIGKGRRLAIGVNGAYLGGVEDDLAYEDDKFDIGVIGADIFFNYYRFTFQAEYDWYKERKKHGYGWYVQSGYLFFLCAELAVRYQELVPIDKANKEQWASVGLNTYFRQHNLKLQTDYTYKRKENGHRKDHVFEIQLQLDF